MCGIAGFWQDGHQSGADLEAIIRTMIAPLSHRGPDGEGVWSDASRGVAFGHRRLAIRDLSANGHQPMLSSDGRFVIAFNGEIYNVEALRERLDTAEPLRLRGTSDTEVFLEAVVRLGLDDALTVSVGMFAFALWDRQDQALFLARDRFGEKPLYFSQVGSDVVFGSELRSLRPFPGVPTEPDHGSVALFLRYGYVPSPMTIIQGVNKVPPGEYVEFRRCSGGVVRKTVAYWGSETHLCRQIRRPSPYLSLSKAVDGAEEVLSNAVKRQLISDVPLGAFLSGGIDSSLIVALMCKVAGTRPKTFTIGFGDAKYDEAPYARAVARYLGTEHVEEYVDRQDIFDIIPMLGDIYDEPIGDSSVIPTVLLSRITRKHVTVALSGDGGDELFGGYNHYRWGPNIIRQCGFVPSPLRRPVGNFLSSCGQMLGNRRVVRLGETLSGSADVSPSMLMNANIPDIQTIVQQNSAECRWYNPPQFPLETSEALMAFDLSGHLPHDILAKVDRASMAFSLESRAPFLDHSVAEFAWSLPSNFKTSRSSGKIVLKALLSKLIPLDLFERPKSGFGFPLQLWLRNEIKDLASKYILHFPSRYEQWLNRDGILALWEQHQSGKLDRQRELWTVMSLLMWMEAQNI